MTETHDQGEEKFSGDYTTSPFGLCFDQIFRVVN